MLSFIAKKLRFQSVLKQNARQADAQAEESETQFSADIGENLKKLKAAFAPSSDLVFRDFAFSGGRKAAIIFIDGLTDKTLVNEDILKPLMLLENAPGTQEPLSIEAIESELLFVGGIAKKDTINEAVQKVLAGDTLLLVDGQRQALTVSLRGWKMRGIEEPQTESTVRGPREGFTETLRVNTSLLRRKIKNANLTFESMSIGERTATDVCIAYIAGLAKAELIDEIKTRLKKIKTDAILESGHIEQFIEDNPYSIFSTVANSEKPDKVAAKLLEGRAAIFVDGTPFVLTVPMVFLESFQAAEDYYSRPYFASAIRLLRFVAFFISILAPALYVAMTTFHQELIPTKLLLSMAAAHEGVPFPAVIEAAIMMMIFEILREAGVRLPRPVGQAVSIVGALVIGESAVSAGLIGAPMVIVVAVTAVAAFTVPSQTDAFAIVRFGLLVLSGIMGGFGILIGLLAMLIHLISLTSFGTPYLMPLAPFDTQGQKDTFVRAPIWTLKKRPVGMSLDDTRQNSTQVGPAAKDGGQQGD